MITDAENRRFTKTLESMKRDAEAIRLHKEGLQRIYDAARLRDLGVPSLTVSEPKHSPITVNR